MKAHASLLVLAATVASLLATATVVSAAPPSAPPACAQAIAHADRAVGSAYAHLARAAAGAPANERAIIAMRLDRTFTRNAASCRTWAIASGAPRRGTDEARSCFRAIEGVDAYLVTIEQEVELLRSYGGRPDAGTIDAHTIRMLGRLGTGQLRYWLWSSEQCLAAIGPARSAIAASMDLSSSGSAFVSAGSSRLYAATARNESSAALPIPIVWSVTPATVGTIDNTGFFEAAAAGGCGRIVATAGDISAWADVCVIEAATASY